MSNRSLKISGIILLVLCGVYILIYFLGPQFTDRISEIFFTRIVKVKCLDYKQSAFSRKLNNKIPDYIETSILNGIIKCKDESDLRHRVDEGKLVRIKGDRGYVIEQMSHSYPYLTKEGRDLLQEIGKRFREKISDTRMKGSSFRITSLTRTTEKLRDLRHVNSNTSMNSPHLYGNAFDISYVRFTTRKFYVTQCDKKYLKEALAEVIWQLRNERRCWATYETNQNCFHVVAR
jgi:hypothetical protein